MVVVTISIFISHLFRDLNKYVSKSLCLKNRANFQNIIIHLSKRVKTGKDCAASTTAIKSKVLLFPIEVPTPPGPMLAPSSLLGEHFSLSCWRAIIQRSRFSMQLLFSSWILLWSELAEALVHTHTSANLLISLTVWSSAGLARYQVALLFSRSGLFDSCRVIF